MYSFKGRPYDPDVINLTGGEGGKTVAGGQMRTRLSTAYFFNPYDSGKRTGEHREPKTPVVKDPTAPDYYQQVAAVGDGRRLFSTYISDPLIAAAFERDQVGGPAHGISLGNVFLDFVAREAGGDLGVACQHISEFLGLPPILPITASFAHLQGEWANSGDQFFREHEIDNPGPNQINPISRAWLTNPVLLNPAFEQMLAEGKRKVVQIGPGSLIGSNISILLTDGLTDVLDQANPWITYICNLATVPGETIGMSVRDHVEMINSYLGRHKVDEVLVNNAPPSDAVKRQYGKKDQEILLPRPGEFDGLDLEFDLDNYVSSRPARPDDTMTDEEVANLYRHDGWKLAGKTDFRVRKVQGLA